MSAEKAALDDPHRRLAAAAREELDRLIALAEAAAAHAPTGDDPEAIAQAQDRNAAALEEATAAIGAASFEAAKAIAAQLLASLEKTEADAEDAPAEAVARAVDRTAEETARRRAYETDKLMLRLSLNAAAAQRHVGPDRG